MHREQLAFTERTSIDIRRGEEGPRHDPYSYTEITVGRQNGHQATIHLGLTVWCDFIEDGVTLLMMRHADEAACRAVFEKVVGMTPEQAERYKRGAQSAEYRRHKSHGGVQWSEGFPGEQLCFCKCGAVVDLTFNIGAIE